MSKLSPIVLFSYKRLVVLKKTVEALQSNSLAPKSELFIFSTAAQIATNQAKTDKLRQYCRNITGFKSVSIKEYPAGQGLAKSIIAGVSQVINSFARVIVIEDDLVSSPYFLEYMNKALDHYENEKKVFCLNGMGYLSPGKLPSKYKEDFYFLYRPSSHGWATWADRWAKNIWEPSYFKKELQNYKNRDSFNKGGNDLSPMLQAQLAARVDSWAVRWAYTISKNGGIALSPRYSYISHLDTEGGTHIEVNFNIMTSNLSKALPASKISFPSSLKIDPSIAKSSALLYGEVPHQLQNLKDRSIKYTRKHENLETKSLKVALLSTNLDGGAGMAALRLHKALLAAGLDSFLFVKNLTVDAVANLFQLKSQRSTSINESILKKYFHTGDNTPMGNTIFSPSYPSLSYRELDFLLDFDVIHLHWVQAFLSTEAIAYILRMGKPVIWTFHDKNPLTGGCHSFHGCDNWLRACEDCPQLIDTFGDYPAKQWSLKKQLFTKNLSIIALCQEFKELIGTSPIFAQNRVDIIYNTLELDIYRPVEVKNLKRALHISSKKHVLLYAAAYNSTIKGYSEFLQLLEQLERAKYHIVLLGDFDDKILNSGFSYTAPGLISAPKKMAEYYALADLTVLPSLEDNLPNTMLESLACATPVIAFEVGGIPDIIEDAKSGYIVKRGDIDALAKKIGAFSRLPANERTKMGLAGRRLVEERLAPHIIAEQHRKLYKSLLCEDNIAAPPIPFVGEFAPATGAIYHSLYEKETEKLLQTKTCLPAKRASPKERIKLVLKFGLKVILRLVLRR